MNSPWKPILRLASSVPPAAWITILFLLALGVSEIIPEAKLFVQLAAALLILKWLTESTIGLGMIAMGILVGGMGALLLLLNGVIEALHFLTQIRSPDSPTK